MPPTPGRALLVALALLGLWVTQSTSLSAATIAILNNDSSNEGFNDPTPATPVGGNPGTTVGQQRLTVFQRAGEIWAALLDTDLTILVRANFDPLPCDQTSGVLGAAAPTFVDENFGGGALADTWYVAAQANAMAGRDLHPADPEIRATFQSNLGAPGCLPNLSWYYGLDGNAGSGQVDLLITVLHEMGHGLGFLSLVEETDGTLFVGQIDIYSRFLFDNTTNKFWDAMSNTERKNSAINSNGLVWTGPTVTAEVPNVLDNAPVLAVTAPDSIAGFTEVATAVFGPAVTAGGISGELVLVDDGSGSELCQPIQNGSEVNGNIAVVDRGTCSFVDKVSRAEAAGAIAVVVVNNVAGPPIAMGGDDTGITIPSVMISKADGDAIRAPLESGGVVTAELRVDAALRAGADIDDRLKMFAPDPVQPGSSVSHWDLSASPDLLMEPFISPALVPDVDLTIQALSDMGWPVLGAPEGKVTFFSAVRQSGGALLTWLSTGPRDGVRTFVYRQLPRDERVLLGEATPPEGPQASYTDEDPPDSQVDYWLEVDWPETGPVFYGPARLNALQSASVFRLLPAAPNPFATESTIRYDLPRSGVVRITIVDVRGRHVRLLKQVEEIVGSRQAVWDGRNDAGKAMATGVYFARVEFEGTSQLQKLILLQ